MHEKRIITEQCTREIDIPKCDLCKRDLTGERDLSSCPSDKVLLPLFIGYDTLQRGMYGDVFGSKYGIENIELCKGCREDWFRDILSMFPNSRLVKIND